MGYLFIPGTPNALPEVRRAFQVMYGHLQREIPALSFDETVTGRWTFADGINIANIYEEVLDAGVTFTGDILLQAYGIGNDNPVLTFAAGVEGAATFTGTVTADDFYVPTTGEVGMSAKGRFVFTDAATDTITVTDANLYMGANALGNSGAVLTFAAGATGTASFSGFVHTGNGTNTTPSHSFASDPDIGMYRVTTNTLGLAAAGVRMLQLTASQATIGGGVAGVDYSLRFDGQTNDGLIVWAEDEDYFRFYDSILMDTTEPLYLNTTAFHVSSDGTDLILTSSANVNIVGGLDLAANSILGTSVDINNAELQQLSAIGATTISGAQWAFVGNMDQDVDSGSAVAFAGLTLTGNLLMGANGIGNDSSVLTFGEVAMGAGATFSATVEAVTSFTAPKFIGPDGVQYGIDCNELITFNAAGTIAFSGADVTMSGTLDTLGRINCRAGTSPAAALEVRTSDGTLGYDFSPYNSASQPNANTPWIRVGGGASSNIVINGGTASSAVAIAVDNASDCNLCSGGGTINLQSTALVATNKQVQFRATTQYIASLNTGYMDYAATTAHRFAGAVTMDTSLTVTGPGTFTVAAGEAVAIRSGAAGSFAAMTLGRTAIEAYLGVVASAGQFFTDTVAGDIIYRVEATARSFFIGSGTTGVADLRIGNGAVEVLVTGLMSGTNQLWFNDSGTYWNSPSNGVLAGVTDGTLTLGAAATNQEIITSTGLTYWTGTGGIPFAGMYVVGNAVETAIGGAGTFVQVTVFTTDGEYLDAVPAHAQDHITITKAGKYMIVCACHLESIGAGAADLVSLKIAKNNGTVDLGGIHGHRKLAGGGGDVGSMTISGLADLAATDTIEVWIANDDNATNLLVADINISLFMVGGT